MEKAEICSQLRRSHEMTFIRRQMGGILIISVLVSVWYLLISSEVPQSERWGLLGTILGLSVVPFLIFYGLRTVRIFRKAESYRFHQVLLDRPVAGALRDTVRFRVRIRCSDGHERLIMTHGIFQNRGYGFLMEDYVNRTVAVAYNEETQMLVVLG